MLKRKDWSPKITDEVIADAVADHDMDDLGYCLVCGHEASGVEPDARNYSCESCGAEQVFGAEELLMAIAL